MAEMTPEEIAAKLVDPPRVLEIAAALREEYSRGYQDGLRDGLKGEQDPA